MGLRWPSPGVNSVPEYQVAATPWVTGALAVDGPQKIALPSVSQYFIVSNTGGTAVNVGFTADGVSLTSNFFTVAASSIQRFDTRVRDIFVSSSAATTLDIFAGLTSISTRHYLPLTGANPAPTGSQHLPGV
jgi:hypothetical protein